MIKAEITGDKRVAFRLASFPDAVRKELATTMKRITFQLVRYVQSQKLSGQVLKRQTGTLSRSIKSSVNSDAISVKGVVDSRDKGNAPLSYAHYHEYGFEGTETVKAHLRHLKSGTIANVRAHTRQVKYPAHAFLRPSLEENQGMIEKEVNAAVKKASHE